MEKIKISWEPTEIWNHEDFRQLIKAIHENTYSTFEFELWIITINSNLNYIKAIADQFNIPQERTLMALNDSTKVGLITLNTDIHFDEDYTIIKALEVTKTKGILVDRKIAYGEMGLKYIKDLDTWTSIIIRERNGEKTKPC